jgi:hypothetical protein
LELYKKVYALRVEILGEKNPSTLLALNNLAYGYSDMGEYQIALKLDEKLYSLRCEVLGEKHIYTIDTLYNIAYTHIKLGGHVNFKKAFHHLQKVYRLRCEVLGINHPKTQEVEESLKILKSLL